MRLNKKLYDLVAGVLAVKPETIADNTAPGNTPSWDSFNALMLVAELEKASGAQFAMLDVMAVKNVGDIKKILEKYGVEYE